MKLNKNRADLEIEIKGMVDEFATNIDKNEIDLVAEHLNAKHGIKLTDVYSVFNNSNNVSKFSDAEISLFGEQIGLRLGLSVNEWKDEWFTNREIEEYSRYQHIDSDKYDEIEYPYTLENVSDLGNGYYMFALEKSVIGRMRKYGKLNYNENVQRGLKRVVRHGSEFFEPIIFPNKIESIKQSILKGESLPSTIVLNASQMSAKDGLELEYNSNKSTLTIHEGTVLDIVDGMHRVLGTYSAWLENKELTGSYVVIISNKSDEEVRLHQVDIDRSTKLTRGRIKEMDNKSQMNEVINILKTTRELKGKITSATDSKTGVKGDELFPYKILLDILEDNFKVDNTLAARKLAEQISEYNVYLFGYFGEHQKDKYSLLFDVEVYEGHLNLMNKMINEGVSFDKLNELINIEDFNKNYYLWKDLKLIGDNLKKLNKSERSKLIYYFTSLID